MFYILSNAGILGIIYPFAFGFLYALVWCNQRVYVICPLYILAFTLANFSVAGLIISSVTATVILLMYLLHLRIKKPIKPYLLVIYALISQSAFVYLNIIKNIPLLTIISTLVIGILFLLSNLCFFSAITIRGITSKLKVIEIISGFIFIMAVSCGLNEFSYFIFEPVKFIGCLLILLLAYSSNFSLLFASAWGIGTILNGANAVYVAPFILYALVCLPFKHSKRIFLSVAVIGLEALIGFGLNLYYNFTYLSLLPTVVAGLIFFLIPQSWLESLSSKFTSAVNLAMRNIVNRNRDSLKKRFLSLSDVFSEMDGVFRTMIKGGLTQEQACALVMSEISEKLCQNCPERTKCHRIYEREMKSVFNELIIISLEREEITLLDIPPFLASRCGRINALVSIINENSKQLKQYANFMNSVDSGKILVAQQLNGISLVMKNLAEEVGKNIVFENEKENKLMEVLNYNNIICSEALIYQQQPNIVNVTLAIKKDCEKKAKISKIVSKVLGLPMSVYSSSGLQNGFSMLTLKNAPKFEIVFGTAGTPKLTNNVSGDCYSLIRLENDKFIMAVCDGMGNGEKAENVSSLTLGLVENFYKAGFDNELILNVVNNLLNIKNEEDMFSALDLCVVDLKNGIADFIKLGASIGFVKHITHTSIIKCESLPVGIIKEIKPVVNKVVLSAGDTVVLCSDGITDTFESEEIFCEFINNIESVNPQDIANEILEMAKTNCENDIKDDMTVLVGRIYAL